MRFYVSGVFTRARGERPRLMRLDREAFESWARAVSPIDQPYSLSQVAARAGVPKTTLAYQARRGYVSASVVLEYSRALGLSPVEELARFEQFAVYQNLARPSPREVLSQLPPETYLEELVSRIHGTTSITTLGPIPGPWAMKRWLDSYVLWGQYDQLADQLGLSSRDRLSEKIRYNRLTLAELTGLIEAAELTPRFGLVVAGLASLAEVGYPADLFGSTLTATSSVELVNVLDDNLRWLAKRVEELDSQRRDDTNDGQ